MTSICQLFIGFRQDIQISRHNCLFGNIIVLFWGSEQFIYIIISIEARVYGFGKYEFQLTNFICSEAFFIQKVFPIQAYKLQIPFPARAEYFSYRREGQ